MALRAEEIIGIKDLDKKVSKLKKSDIVKIERLCEDDMNQTYYLIVYRV